MLILVTLLEKGMFAIGCRPGGRNARMIIPGVCDLVFPWMEDEDGYEASLLELPNNSIYGRV